MRKGIDCVLGACDSKIDILSTIFSIHEIFHFRAQGNAQLSGAARSAILRPKDTLGLSGTMNLSRSTEDLKPHPPNSTLGKILQSINQRQNI